MDLHRIIEEVWNSGGGNYPAYSEAPRKDFAPGSNKPGYAAPYQSNSTYGTNEPPPDAPSSLPWPLQTVTTDFADSFVYLMAGINKIVQCLKQNPSIDKDAKEELVEIYKKSRNALNVLKEVGLSINRLNMAYPQPSQNPIPNTPDQRINPGAVPNINQTIAIKLP